MADIVLNVTIPEDKVETAIAAIKLQWPACVGMTNAQIKTYTELRLFDYLKHKITHAKRETLDVDVI